MVEQSVDSSGLIELSWEDLWGQRFCALCHLSPSVGLYTGTTPVLTSNISCFPGLDRRGSGDISPVSFTLLPSFHKHDCHGAWVMGSGKSLVGEQLAEGWAGRAVTKESLPQEPSWGR